jgi:hypothetical protein
VNASETRTPEPGTTGPTTPAHTCGGCTTRWTGTGTAHCASCHRTFSAVSGFDTHRRNGTCVDPATVGLVHNDTRRCWTFPPPDPTKRPIGWRTGDR